MNEFLAPRTLTERWGFLFEENPSVLPGLCILSGKRVYDIYYGEGKSRQNSTPKKNKVVKNEFLYVSGCG